MNFLNTQFPVFTLLITYGARHCGSSTVDPRWNTGILPEKEVVRIKSLLKNITYLIKDRSKGEWFPLKREGPLPPHILRPSGTVKMLIHGYTINHKQTLYKKMEEQHLWDLGNEYADWNKSYNVFLVDWTALSTETLKRYYEASEATKYVGEDVARFLIRLANESYITDWNHVHLIGFSLGGHTVGRVGHKVQELAGVKIGRITGLDPAGPNFEVNGNLPEKLERVIDPSDAKFVDIIHCNMRRPEKSMLGYLGTFAQSGNADFYPNGGETQTTCTRKADMSLTPCSHLTCPEFLRDSIRNPRVACPCQDWEKYAKGKCECTLESGGMYMGEHCSPK